MLLSAVKLCILTWGGVYGTDSLLEPASSGQSRVPLDAKAVNEAGSCLTEAAHTILVQALT